jgi:hypothetical protein
LSKLHAESGDLENMRRVLVQGLRDAGKQPDLLLQAGAAAMMQADFDESERCLMDAMALEPKRIGAHYQMGMLRHMQGRLDDARRQFEHVLTLQPEHRGAEAALSCLDLSMGLFEHGWRRYEARWRDAGPPHPYADLPAWVPGHAYQRPILIYAEQGLGDEILFLSCLPDFLRTGTKAIIACDQRLLSIVRRSFPGVEAVSREQASNRADWLRRVDAVLAMGSLPRYFRRNLQDFPAAGAYFQAEPARVECWRKRLETKGTGLKVGISWRGGTAMSRQHMRTIELPLWGKLLALPDVEFVDLQYGEHSTDLCTLSSSFRNRLQVYPEVLQDLDETAALIGALDLVISVCTSVVSLCASINRPCWVLVPASPGWIFMQAGKTTPWMPCHRLYRQNRFFEWGDVLDLVAADLNTHVKGEEYTVELQSSQPDLNRVRAGFTQGDSEKDFVRGAPAAECTENLV